MRTRILGIICIVASSIWTLDALRGVALGLDDVDSLGSLAGTIWAVGSVCAVVGMLRLHVVGANAAVRVLACVPIVGFVLLVAGVRQLADVVTTDMNVTAAFGWLFQLAGTVLLGILTIAARIWRDWRRFVPLLCVAPVPAGLPACA